MKRLSLLFWFLCQCTGSIALQRGAALQSGALRAQREHIRAAEATRTAISGGGNLTLRHNGVPLKAVLNLAAGIGGFVRLDVSTDLGTSLLAFAANPQTVALIDFQHRRFSSRPAGPADLGGLGLPELDARALSKLLLTRVPCSGEPDAADATHAQWEHCLGGSVLARYAAAGTPLLQGLALQQKDGSLQAEFFGHTGTGAARRIVLETPGNHVVIELDEIDQTGPLDEALFSLQAPPGIASSAANSLQNR